MRSNVLQVHELDVATKNARIVEEFSLEVARGEAVGLVGESGSGKTTVALALLGHTRKGAFITNGSVTVSGEELIGRNQADLRNARGRLVSYVSQDPATALNPSLRVGALIRELVQAHRPDFDPEEAVTSALERVQLPSDRNFQRRYPHQLSGGQQQRLAIAMALACEPPLIVLDEPTTGLDVVIQARILEEVIRLREDAGVAIVYVSHDLAVVAEVCDRIAVMYAGRILEEGKSSDLVREPRHPYTQALLSSVPDHVRPRRLLGIPGVAAGIVDRPGGCAFAPRCPLRIPPCTEALPALATVGPARRSRCLRWSDVPPVSTEARMENPASPNQEPLLSVAELRAVYHLREGDVIAADDVSFDVHSGECVALVGESGSGKTTTARCIVGLHMPTAGRITLAGEPLAPIARKRPPEARRRIQIVFQNPYESLNPRRTVQDALLFALRRLRGLSGGPAREEAAHMLERVRLPASLSNRYPSELSGGERQRVAIARALIAQPDLLVCDEVTSALDVSVQAAVLDLLSELRRDLSLSLLLITHDLGVVASVADRVLVLEHGVVREQGTVDDILSRPTDEYTRRLIAAAPSLTPES